MSKSTGVHPGQLSIPSYIAELVPAGDYPGVAPTSRIALVGLIDRAGQGIAFGREPSHHDYLHAVPAFIETGLYSAPGSIDSKRSAEHFVWLGVSARRDSLKPRRPESNPDKPNDGVAFQPIEFKVVAHSARALGSHMVTRTRGSHWGEADRANAEQAARRSAGHVLGSMIKQQGALSTQLVRENEVHRHLTRHLNDPPKVRSYARRLEAERALAVEKIHDTAEVAVMYLGLGNMGISGMHRALKMQIYSGNYSHAQRTANLIGLLEVVGMHNRAKLYKLAISQARCERELRHKYQPALDQKAAQEKAARENTAV